MQFRVVQEDEDDELTPTEELQEKLFEENPDAQLIPEFEEGFVGIQRSNPPVAVYDYWYCVSILVESGYNYWAAIEYIHEDVLKRFSGKSAPVLVEMS